MPVTERFAAECQRMEREALPCPFCGGGGVYAGHADCETLHLQCRRCGASGPVARHPDVYVVPKRFVVDGRVPPENFGASQEWLEIRLLRKAFRLWQTRAVKHGVKGKSKAGRKGDEDRA